MILNGRLADVDLAVIPGTTRRIRADLLPSVIALRDAFLAHFGKPLVITDGYRPYDEQVALFRRYYTTTYLPNRPSRDWQGVRYWQREGMPSAAVPASSNHGWGQALDLGSGVNTSLTSPEHLWMRANGPRFGWTHPAWAHDHDSRNGTDEPWHFEGVVIAAPITPTPAPPKAPAPAPVTVDPEGTPMQRQVIHCPETNTFAVIGPLGSGVRYVLPNQTQVDVAIKLYGPALDLPRIEWDLAYAYPVTGRP